MSKEPEKSNSINRRDFIKGAAILSSFMIVPRHVLGGVGYISPSDQISLGFIGAGKQSFTLFNAFNNIGKVRVLAACDVHKTKMNLFADGVNDFYTKKGGNGTSNSCYRDSDFREMLNRKDIDAVVISVPDHWHAAIAVRAAAAGKDIYCEKPLSLSIAEGRAMVDATHKYKRVFQTGSMQRSWQEFRQTALIMRNGYLGDIQSIKVSVGGPPKPYDLPKEEVPAELDWNFWLGPNEYVHYNKLLNPTVAKTGDYPHWRYYQGLGGGLVTDWGAHMFDIVQWGLDMDKSGPELITPPNGTDPLTFTYANGIKVSHENFGTGNAIQIIGSKGKLVVQRGSLVTDPVSLKDHVFGENEKKVYVSKNHYVDFINAIETRGDVVANVETGHRTATVGNLVNIGYALKRPLKWNPKKEKFINDDEANRLISRNMKKEWKV